MRRRGKFSLVFSIFIVVSSMIMVFTNLDQGLQEGNVNKYTGNNSDTNLIKPSFIGPKGTIPNETLGNLHTNESINVYINSTLLLKPIINLSIEDLEDFFNSRYGTQIVVKNVSDALLNNSIIIGNETVNNITNSLVSNGTLDITGRDPSTHGFDMQQVTTGLNCVVIRAIDDNGHANGLFWLIDRCKTQNASTLQFDYLRSPGLEYRVTLDTSIRIPSETNVHVGNGTSYINNARKTLEHVARRGATHVVFLGGIIGQYPNLLNFSWLPANVYQPNYAEIERRRDFAREYINIGHELGLKVLIWADQGNYVSDGIKTWLEGGGDLTIFNPRVKQFIQGELVELFETLPDLDGITLRVGDDLYSGYDFELMYSPETFREATVAMMEKIDEYNKTMILRTWQMSVRDWCVHASKEAYMSAFGDLYYPNLIISYKYTPNDYQRMPINPTANIGALKQVVELNTLNSFENYQNTPLCMAAHYENVLDNLTSTTNATGQNLLVGVLNAFHEETDLATSNIEGPGSMNSFKYEPNYYYLQRASWEPNVSAVEFCKDLAGKVMGRQFREIWWEWYYTSERAHWHLFFLPYHREDAPWLKSRWFHYTRYIKADPQAFGYIYYFCKKDVEGVINSVKQGFDLAISMRDLLVDNPSMNTTQNQLYFDYYFNLANHFVDFANLSYEYLKTALYFWKYTETLDHAYRTKAYESLNGLKSTLEHYNSTYHYSTDPEQGHKPGLVEVYAFVNWMESHERIEFASWTIFILLVFLIFTSLFKLAKEKKKGREPSLSGNVIFSIWSFILNREKFSLLYQKVNDNNSKRNIILSSIGFIILLSCINGFLLNAASFYNFAGTVYLYAVTASLLITGCIFLWTFVGESSLSLNKKIKGTNSDVRKNSFSDTLARSFYKTSIMITPFMLAQASSALLLALKGPIGLFNSQVIIQMLPNEKFLDFTPISLEGFIVIILLLVSVILMAILIGNLSVEPRPKKMFSRILFASLWSFLIIALLLGATLLWFPNLFDDIDYYLNNAIGVWSPVEFYP